MPQEVKVIPKFKVFMDVTLTLIPFFNIFSIATVISWIYIGIYSLSILAVLSYYKTNPAKLTEVRAHTKTRDNFAYHTIVAILFYTSWVYNGFELFGLMFLLFESIFLILSKKAKTQLENKIV